jgi:hypothetical protein
MMNWKEFGRKQSYRNQVLSSRLSVETEESHDDNQCPDRDSNQTPPECKSGAWSLRQLVQFIGNIAAAGFIEFIAVFF